MGPVGTTAAWADGEQPDEGHEGHEADEHDDPPPDDRPSRIGAGLQTVHGDHPERGIREEVDASPPAA